MFRILPMERFIYLQPIGRGKKDVVDRQTLKRLCTDLAARFGIKCEVKLPIELTEDAYDPLRDQYLAAIILSNLKRMGFPEAEKVLGIVGEDLYADELNFVFGQAELGGKYSVVSVSRLRPSSPRQYENLFYERMLKECVHELGHTFGLGHCPDVRCVMHFSNTLRDTDVKSASFCKRCSAWLGTHVKRVAN